MCQRRTPYVKGKKKKEKRKVLEVAIFTQHVPGARQHKRKQESKKHSYFLCMTPLCSQIWLILQSVAKILAQYSSSLLLLIASHTYFTKWKREINK
jgi:hypothetical protein